MARTLEYLASALGEAEAAAQWYAERSATAARQFSEELDAAEAALVANQNCGRPLTTAHGVICVGAFRSALCIVLSPNGSSSLRSCTSGAGRRTGAGERPHLAEKALQPTSRASTTTKRREAPDAARG